MLDKKLYKQETRNTQLQNGSSFLLVPTVTMPTKYRNEQNCLERNLSFLKSCHTTVYNEALKSNELLRTWALFGPGATILDPVVLNTLNIFGLKSNQINFNNIPWMILMQQSEKPTGVAGRGL